VTLDFRRCRRENRLAAYAFLVLEEAFDGILNGSSRRVDLLADPMMRLAGQINHHQAVAASIPRPSGPRMEVITQPSTITGSWGGLTVDVDRSRSGIQCDGPRRRCRNSGPAGLTDRRQ